MKRPIVVKRSEERVRRKQIHTVKDRVERRKENRFRAKEEV